MTLIDRLLAHRTRARERQGQEWWDKETQETKKYKAEKEGRRIHETGLRKAENCRYVHAGSKRRKNYGFVRQNVKRIIWLIKHIDKPNCSLIKGIGWLKMMHLFTHLHVVQNSYANFFFCRTQKNKFCRMNLSQSQWMETEAFFKLFFIDKVWEVYVQIIYPISVTHLCPTSVF